MTSRATQELQVPSRGRFLAASLTRPRVPSGAAVLFVPGMASSRGNYRDLAQAVAGRHGAVCMALDLGGHGDSDGRLSAVTPRQNLADLTAGYEALAATPGVQRNRIAVCAASYGAYLAVRLTALRPVSRLVLRAPALYTDSSYDSVLGRRRYGDAATAQTVLAQFAAYPGPVTIVQSEFDEVIGAEVIASWLAAQPRAERLVLAGAGHALTEPAWRAGYQRIVVAALAGL